MKRKSKKVEREQRAIASERMERLFALADEFALNGNIERANRYVELARDISMKTNVRVPKHLKMKFCKHCYSYLLPGKTSKTRINSKKHRVEVECFNCKKEMYYSL